jgi:Uma2 family endonuclease
MAIAPSLPSVSVDDYFTGGYETAWEYVDGVLVSRNSGSRDHARMVARLIELLVSQNHRVTSYAGFVLSTSETKYRVPDVVCYQAGVVPSDDFDEQTAPAAIFEILSKTDPMAEMQQKCSEYRQIGTENIFIIDLINKAVLIPSGPGFKPLEQQLELEVNGQTIVIPFTDLFRDK